MVVSLPPEEIADKNNLNCSAGRAVWEVIKLVMTEMGETVRWQGVLPGERWQKIARTCAAVEKSARGNVVSEVEQNIRVILIGMASDVI
jgi:hypothetical protein